MVCHINYTHSLKDCNDNRVDFFVIICHNKISYNKYNNFSKEKAMKLSETKVIKKISDIVQESNAME